MRGEIQHLSDHSRSGHLYLDLVDPEEDAARAGGGGRGRSRGGEPVLKVKCWRTSWAPLRHSLAKEGIELADGMVVVLRGSLDLYRAKRRAELHPGRHRRHGACWAGWLPNGPSCCATLESRGLVAAQRRRRPAGRRGARRAGRQSRDRGLPRLPRPVDRLRVRVPRLARQGAGAGAGRAGVDRPRGHDARAAVAATSSPWCAAEVGGPTWRRSSPRSWHGRWPRRRCRCGRASGTPATRRSRTSWRRVPVSRRPSAGRRSCPGRRSGGAGTSPSRRDSWRTGCRRSCRTRRRVTPGPGDG